MASPRRAGTVPSTRDQPARQAERLEPARGLGTAHDRRGARDVRVQARARGHADRAPHAVGGPSGERVDQVVRRPRSQSATAGRTCSTSRAHRRAARSTGRARRSPARWSSVTRIAPPLRRRRARDRQVAAERHEHAAAGGDAPASAAARSAASAFAVAPRSRLTPPGRRGSCSAPSRPRPSAIPGRRRWAEEPEPRRRRPTTRARRSRGCTRARSAPRRRWGRRHRRLAAPHGVRPRPRRATPARPGPPTQPRR